MNKSTFFKTLAVTNFIALFTLFLFYRNGSFDSYLFNNKAFNFTSPNGGVGAKQTADSLRARIDSIHKWQRTMLSSSKSIVTIDNIQRIDSTPVKPSVMEKEMIPGSKTEMMSSSKSALVIDTRISLLDSLLKAKQKDKPKKKE